MERKRPSPDDRASLPDSARIGRGFIVTRHGASTQCDILIYRSDWPVLFREGDLVFVPPEAVLAVVEVKTRITVTKFRDAIRKLADIGKSLGPAALDITLALFIYESHNTNFTPLLEILKEECIETAAVIKLVSLGCSDFIHWWESSPDGHQWPYCQWHAYHLDNMSAGYFIVNLLDAVTAGVIAANPLLWFPENSKELSLEAQINGPRE